MMHLQLCYIFMQVSSSMRPLKHFKPEPSQSSEGGNSFQELGDQPTESTGESFFSESISEVSL